MCSITRVVSVPVNVRNLPLLITTTSWRSVFYSDVSLPGNRIAHRIGKFNASGENRLFPYAIVIALLGNTHLFGGERRGSSVCLDNFSRKWNQGGLIAA